VAQADQLKRKWAGRYDTIGHNWQLDSIYNRLGITDSKK
jgi:hypothetical protein